MHSLFGYIFCTVVIELDPKARIENQHFLSSSCCARIVALFITFYGYFHFVVGTKRKRGQTSLRSLLLTKLTIKCLGFVIKYEDTSENWYLTAYQFVQNPSHFFSIFSVHQILQSIMWAILLTFHVNLIAQGLSGSRRRSYILHTLLSDRGVMTWYLIHFEPRTADF